MTAQMPSARTGTRDTTPARFTFRPVDPAADAALLHRWIATEHARFWGMSDATLDEVREEHRTIAANPHHQALVAEEEGQPVFLLETYAPEHSQLAGAYPRRPGDAGLHLLLPAPADNDTVARSGFSEDALRASLQHLFADPAVLRVVVEPDARNTAVHSLNSRLGFVPFQRIELPELPGAPAKTALVSWCTRAAFAAATGSPSTSATHLSPGRWDAAQRHVLAKAIGEFAHERLLHPEPATGGWVLRGHGVEYAFSATVHALEHWMVDPASIEVRTTTPDGSGSTAGVPDVQEFVVRFRTELGLADAQLPLYLEELGSTLAGHCFKQLHSTATATELAVGTGDPVADFQRIEASMTEGHPCFVANNGRAGLGTADYLDYAPETGAVIELEWVAAHSTRTHFSAISGLDVDALLDTELDPGRRAVFSERLDEACLSTGLDPEDFLYLPVHPWQWEKKLSVTFAGDIATGHLVHLGSSGDLYQPQQSIRTFFNRSAPRRHYVKTALSVVNMGFMRGLSADYMKATPAINEWLQELFDADPELGRSRAQLIREVAAVGYANPLFHAATDQHSPYRKMLAALWRESPVEKLQDGESLATMASLLHVDAEGKSVAAAMIRTSGLEATEWLGRYFDAYLVPLVHCLAAHDLVFMPHGENVILVLRDGVPQRVLLKDLAEEVAVLGDRTALPEAVERIRAQVPDAERRLVVFTDIVDCFLRFLAPLLEREALATEADFWEAAANSLRAYRARNPGTAQSFDALDLFGDEFELSCLNRLQLRNNQQMLDIGNQSEGLLYAGSLANPWAGR
ncbi:GNAT family N-acetyltransferase [Arthrobacter sp.]|uniref:GNAT family N-acetyltransferase n=1 Tax=Arthrobacter sp. TaxID=1667 RepID=UPI003A8D8AEB